MAISFGSDNHAGVHPVVMQALFDANHDGCRAYGADEHTARVTALIKSQLGAVDAFFVFNGTAANVLSLQALTKSYQAILCASSAHIVADECGAVEKHTGSRLVLCPTLDGKLTLHDIRNTLGRLGDQHAVQPKVVSITQATEWGTVYTIQELKILVDYAHEQGLYVHMDGARLYNAAAALGVSLKALTHDLGIDALSLGGTKNGMMFGEVVVFFNTECARDFKYIRKQGMQLASKMRFIAVQFEALFTNDLWLKNAQHANSMAQLLAHELLALSLMVVQKVEINQVFVKLPLERISGLQEKYCFYTWDEAQSVVRLMTTFATKQEDVMAFIADLKSVIKE